MTAFEAAAVLRVGAERVDADPVRSARDEFERRSMETIRRRIDAAEGRGPPPEASVTNPAAIGAILGAGASAFDLDPAALMALLEGQAQQV